MLPIVEVPGVVTGVFVETTALCAVPPLGVVGVTAPEIAPDGVEADADSTLCTMDETFPTRPSRSPITSSLVDEVDGEVSGRDELTDDELTAGDVRVDKAMAGELMAGTLTTGEPTIGGPAAGEEPLVDDGAALANASMVGVDSLALGELG